MMHKESLTSCGLLLIASFDLTSKPGKSAFSSLNRLHCGMGTFILYPAHFSGFGPYVIKGHEGVRGLAEVPLATSQVA